MKKLFLALAILFFALTACTPAKKPLTQEILGAWKNTDGYTIEFRSGGSGFIPGVAGKIPDTNFTYTIVDENHIQMDLQGENQKIEIDISGDHLTWKDDLGEVAYTRIK
jgi:hypothetical protein